MWHFQSIAVNGFTDQKRRKLELTFECGNKNSFPARNCQCRHSAILATGSKVIPALFMKQRGHIKSSWEFMWDIKFLTFSGIVTKRTLNTSWNFSKNFRQVSSHIKCWGGGAGWVMGRWIIGEEGSLAHAPHPYRFPSSSHLRLRTAAAGRRCNQTAFG